MQNPFLMDFRVSFMAIARDVVLDDCSEDTEMRITSFEVDDLCCAEQSRAD